MKIPDEKADWVEIAEFARTFNGYEYAGDITKLGFLWDRVCIDGLDNSSVSADDLRAMLFLIQRAGRWSGDEGTDFDLQQAHEILRHLRMKASEV